MNKRDLICLATPKFRGNYLKSTVQLMKELSSDFNVLYVDYAYTLKDLLKALKNRNFKLVRKLLGGKDSLEKLELENGHSLHILTLPAILPCNAIKSPKLYDWIMKFNAFLVRPRIMKAQAKLSMKKPAVVNAFQPFLGKHLIGKLGESCTVYYCYDEIKHARWLGHHGARCEADFIPMVDSVVVSSNKLKETKSLYNENIHTIYNGVDFKSFARKLPSSKPAPRKTIGYLGTVDDRVDIKLMQHLMESSPELDFRFVGRCISDKVKLKLDFYSNVYFEGPQDPSSLAQHIESMDVCIIPFESNGFTNAIYPLKVNEYLSRGKAVVSTHFADLSDFYGYIYTANTAREFKKQLDTALLENKPILKEKRIKLASKNSWNGRAKDFVGLISQLA